MPALPLAIQPTSTKATARPLTCSQHEEEFSDASQVPDLLAMIQLDRDTAAVVRALNGAMLHHNDLALPCVTRIGAEQTPGAVGDAPSPHKRWSIYH